MKSIKNLYRLIILTAVFFCAACLKGNAADISDGIYKIQSALDSNKYLDINECSKDEFVRLQLWEGNDSEAQKFYIYKSNDGFFKIRAICSVKMISYGSYGAGSDVFQKSEDNTDFQKWYISTSDNGSVQFSSKAGGLFLDVSGAGTENGTKIQLWENNGTDAQKFFLIPIKEFNTSGYTISSNKADMQVDKVKYLMKFLGKSWNTNETKEIINNSQMCFGAYDESGNQIGFARVITDYETTCFIMNVVVDECCRGKGIGTMLIRNILEHEKLSKCRFSLIPSNEKVAAGYNLVGFRNSDFNYMITEAKN